jgi:hypothetical protein
MILRRYGTSVQSVDINFDSKALTEVGFRRNQERSEPADTFVVEWERVRGHEIAGEAEGTVQDAVEKSLLEDMEAELRRLDAELAPEEVILVESEQGADYPKTRTKTRTVVVDGENRLHFTTTVDPPLRVAVYRKRGAAG